MPFTARGMTPDILINPHAFPSRMTIGMLIESMAGKAGALHGIFQDGTPFQFHEEHTAVDYIGEQLEKAGYNCYGSEPLYVSTYLSIDRTIALFADLLLLYILSCLVTAAAAISLYLSLSISLSLAITRILTISPPLYSSSYPTLPYLTLPYRLCLCL